MGNHVHFPQLYPTARILEAGAPERAGSVAVIMRTKDRPLLLHRALASVLSQTYENWRLYLINDGGNRTIVDELLLDYEQVFCGRLTVVHHPHSLGMENASNAGLALASEEFAVIHDDDDSWHPEFMAETVAFLSKPANARCVAVTTGCTAITERVARGSVEEVDRWRWPHNRMIDFAELLQANSFPPICLMFRRAAVDHIGSFNGELPVLGDWEFNIRLLLIGDIDYIDRQLAYYHHREPDSGDYGNTVVDGTSRHMRQATLLHNSLLRMALQERPTDIGIVQIMQRRQVPATAVATSPVSLDIVIEKMDIVIEKIDRLEAQFQEVRMIASWHRKLLRPVHWIWIRAFPARQAIARLRGRV